MDIHLRRLYDALKEPVPENTQGLAEAWAPAMGVLALCTSLHTGAFIDFPVFMAQMLLLRLPDTLESLSVLLHHDHEYPTACRVELPGVSRCTSLRNITLVQTIPTEDTLRRLLQTTSITCMNDFLCRGSRSPRPVWLQFIDALVDWQLFQEVGPEPFIKHTRFVFLDWVDPSSRISRIRIIEYLPPDFLAQSKQRSITFSVMDPRDDSGGIDAVRTLYDN